LAPHSWPQIRRAPEDNLNIPEQARFVRDDPDSLGADAFGHRDYADALLSIVRDPEPPGTVALFGPWGVGKSTIIGGMQKELEADPAIGFVYFDAWRYEGDSLRRQLLTETAEQLDEGNQLDGYDPKKQLRDLEFDQQEIREDLRFNFERLKRAGILGFGFAVIALALLLLGIYSGLLGGNFGTSVLQALIVFTVSTLAGALGEVVVVTPKTFTRRALSDPDRFAKKFTELLDRLKPKRLVIAIDNLDRCSPEKAVQMLGTIKTYLEPAIGGEQLPRSVATPTVDREIVFVLAVDDEALRRHLVAQELDHAHHEDEIAVRRYVEEYLAKFFNSRLPVRQILADDMRAYVEANFREMCEQRGIEGETPKRLISMVAGALRRNPRGVKQFQNDLEARLRLLEERELEKDDEKRIDPPLSGEVAIVAKLALIESVWPEAFALLEHDPRLLERWNAEAAESADVDWRSGEERAAFEADVSLAGVRRSAAHAKSTRAFGEFLRLSASTEAANVRALLGLKQARIEVRMPGFSEFRQALLGGERETVEKVLGEASASQQEDIAGKIPELLRAELSSGYLDAARVIVDTLISLEVFDSMQSVRRAVLEIAVQSPELRDQLTSLNAAAVLADAELLGPGDRAALFEPFVGRLLDTDLEAPARQSLADALAGHVEELPPGPKRSIKAAIDEQLAGEIEVYLPLARADPSLIGPGAIKAALDQLAKPSGVDPSPSTRRRFRAWLPPQRYSRSGSLARPLPSRRAWRG
jgi:KAP family P-loop domain